MNNTTYIQTVLFGAIAGAALAVSAVAISQISKNLK